MMLAGSHSGWLLQQNVAGWFLEISKGEKKRVVRSPATEAALKNPPLMADGKNRRHAPFQSPAAKVAFVLQGMFQSIGPGGSAEILKTNCFRLHKLSHFLRGMQF